ncbi:hypothetical protein DENSPDRAFT_839470 [Dentipellis sp. KUC8613]|nr:hypothetical protein DENSPDRAFT_839470 [Dentipellis sp. KUC8613]
MPPSSSPEPADEAFFALPSSLRVKIDRAFDRAAGSSRTSTSVRAPRTTTTTTTSTKSNTPAAGGFLLPEEMPGGGVQDAAPGGFIPAAAAGGFLLDDEPAAGGFMVDDPPAAGGFVVDDAPAAGGFVLSDNDDGQDQDEDGSGTRGKGPTHISFARIPAALQSLDLPPDDEEVLAVFRNAASGWPNRPGRGRREGRSGAEGAGGDGEGTEEIVSRKDWRAVCAVLLDTGGAEGSDEDMNEDQDEDQDQDVDIEEQEIEESEGDATSDEYVEPSDAKPGKRRAAQSASSRRTRKRKASPSDSSAGEDDEDAPQLTARQKRECLKAFALFFPDFSVERDGEDALRAKKIGVRELSKAASVLKEKIKAEEMVEMLETFSTSPDKTVGLSDFERMMYVTRMA